MKVITIMDSSIEKMLANIPFSESVQDCSIPTPLPPGLYKMYALALAGVAQ